MVLYPEDDNHVEVLSRLQSNGYQYLGILHNRDKDHENCDKKEHWHIMVVFNRQKDLNPLAEELGIASHYLEPCRNREATEKYFLHLGYPDKTQYETNELFGTLAKSVTAHLDTGITEAEKVLSLVQLLDELPVPCSYRAFLLASCEAGLYSIFRRMGAGALSLLKEHNGAII